MRLDDLSASEAEAAFLACCGSTAWARAMAEGRPYRDDEDLLEAADRVWWSLAPADWLEAFAAHPRIGERKDDGDERFRRWSEQEQAGAASTGATTLAELTEANRIYAERFGYIFIVCATGKSAEEMLGLLRSRLANEAEAELRIAAEEQRKITRIRLGRWLGDLAASALTPDPSPMGRGEKTQETQSLLPSPFGRGAGGEG